MFDKILEVLSSLGLPGVFIGVFLEAIGLPFPGSILVSLAGFLSKQGEFSIVSAWLVSMLGYVLGSFSAFMIGRYFGETLLARWKRYIRLTPERMEKAQRLLQKSAPVYVIGGRFLPTIGNITPYVAGISNISMVKYLVCDMVHAVLWLTIFLGAGVVFGNEWHGVTESPWVKWISLGGGLLILSYVLWRLFFVSGKERVK